MATSFDAKAKGFDWTASRDRLQQWPETNAQEDGVEINTVIIHDISEEVIVKELTSE